MHTPLTRVVSYPFCRISHQTDTLSGARILYHALDLTFRWGSEESFEDEMRTRRVRAEAAYEARKNAFNEQAPGPALECAGSLASSDERGRQHQAPKELLRFPSRPRILGLADEANSVGVDQQKHHVLSGEKYGFYTVVHDAYFNAGPTVRP